LALEGEANVVMETAWWYRAAANGDWRAADAEDHGHRGVIRRLSASSISYLLACVIAREAEHLRGCETCSVDPHRCDEYGTVVARHKQIERELMPDRRRSADRERAPVRGPADWWRDL
jgi:hypothetical protein